MSDVDDLDGPARGEEAAAVAPLGRPRPRRAVIGVLVAVAVLAAATAVHHQVGARADAGPPLDGSASASELFPVLADEASAAGFPDASLSRALRVAPDTAHQLAVTPDAVYWVAQDADGAVCLLARDLTGEGSSGGVCSTPAELARRPLRLASGAGGAALAPRGQDATGLLADGYAALGSGLWVDGEAAAGIVEAAVDSTSTRIVVIPSQAHRGSSALPVFTADDLSPYVVVLACLRSATVGVSVAGDAAERTRCSGGSIARHVTGTGREVVVRVDAPADLVWAASIVACTGAADDPVC